MLSVFHKFTDHPITFPTLVHSFDVKEGGVDLFSLIGFKFTGSNLSFYVFGFPVCDIRWDAGGALEVGVFLRNAPMLMENLFHLFVLCMEKSYESGSLKGGE